MWKSNKFLVISLGLLSFLLASLQPSFTYAIEQKSFEGLDLSERQSFSRILSPLNSIPANVKYFIYRDNSVYPENALQVLAYTCDYAEYFSEYNHEVGGYGKVSEMPDCGVMLEYSQQSGNYIIKLKAASYSQKYFFLDSDGYSGYLEGKDNYNSSYIKEYQDSTIYLASGYGDNPFVVYENTHSIKNEWSYSAPTPPPQNDPPQEQPKDEGGLFSGIGGFFTNLLNGIKEFFQPMKDSLDRFSSWSGTYFDNLKNGIVSVFSGMFENIANIWDFFSNFFSNLFKELLNFLKYILLPDGEVIKQQISDFTSYLKNNSGSLGRFFGSIGSSISVRHSVSCQTQGYYGGSSFGLNFCSIPQELINLARPLIVLSIFWATGSRILHFVSVLLGSRYMWEKKGEDQ